MKDVLHWAAEHPVPVAVGVFALGAIVLLATSHGGGSQAGAGMGAFYAAQAAQVQAGANLAARQSDNATALGIASLQAGVAKDKTAALVTMAKSDNDLAAYQTYKQVRLQTQQSQEAQYLASTGGNLADFTAALSNVNHGLSFGTAH